MVTVKDLEAHITELKEFILSTVDAGEIEAANADIAWIQKHIDQLNQVDEPDAAVEVFEDLGDAHPHS